jgi:S1-C subfamily serine protease
VNGVDVAIVVLVLGLATLGYERGLIASALALAGFIGGAALGARLGPELLAEGPESPYAPVITVMCGMLLGSLLAVALEGIGRALGARFARSLLWRRLDGAGGAALLGALALVLAWAFGAAALHAPGPGARDFRSALQRSAILTALNDLVPPSGPLLNVLRRIDATPTLQGPEARVRPPEPAILDDPDVQRAGESVVKVLGTACGLGVEGSGWVAGHGLVVTNAHVVAGQDDTSVTPPAGGELEATAVHYAPRNDLAILRVGSLGLQPLALGAPRPGTAGAVMGYPENGPLALSAARLGPTAVAISQDSYGRGPIRRPMTSFRGEVRSGNSGGPLVDAAGRVLTTVFAAEAGGGPPGGLGVPNRMVKRALEGELGPVDTGPCA